MPSSIIITMQIIRVYKSVKIGTRLYNIRIYPTNRLMSYFIIRHYIYIDILYFYIRMSIWLILLRHGSRNRFVDPLPSPKYFTSVMPVKVALYYSHFAFCISYFRLFLWTVCGFFMKNCFAVFPGRSDKYPIL